MYQKTQAKNMPVQRPCNRIVLLTILSLFKLVFERSKKPYNHWIFVNLDKVKSGLECWNIFGTTQVAPGAGGDTNYHGYIKISEEEAKKLNNDYHWVVDLNPLPDMGNINLTSYNVYDWYVCEDFNKDKFYDLGMRDIRYDKNGTIIFSNEFQY